jgi:DNA recombination protein RmuC
MPALWPFLAGFALALGLAWILLRRANENARRMDLVLSSTAAAREASETVDRRFDEMRRSVEERVQSVERSLTEGHKRIDARLDSSGELWKNFGQAIGRLFEAVEKTERLATDVTKLQDLLKPPKIRGTLGETFLEQALSQVLPPGAWHAQHRFADGEIVDAVIEIGERLVPVDSKFPLENYRRARELEDEGERRRASRAFAADVRRHIDSIAEKYIRPACGTYDFALMYIPAEAVYCEIATEGVEDSLADYALRKRVFPVSPRLFYAYLSTVAFGLKGLALEQNAREIQERLADLSHRWDEVGEPFATLGRHLGNAAKQYQEASNAFSRFSGRLAGIAERAEAELEPSLAPVPLPPPS